MAMHIARCEAMKFPTRSVSQQLRRGVLPDFRPRGPLSKSRCELWALDIAREESEETAEQDDSEMLRLTSSAGGGCMSNSCIKN